MIELHDSESGLSAALCPERGALVSSLRWQGTELLYLDRDSFSDPARSVRGGIPLLFPICGPLQDGCWQQDGRTYRMPQHGLVRQASWELVGSGSDTAAWSELKISSSAQTEEHYPFDFELGLRVAVSGRRLRMEFSVTHQGAAPMPFQLGLHPYFQADKSRPVEWQLPVDAFVDSDARDAGEQPYAGDVPVAGRSVDWEFPRWRSRTADVWPAAHGIRMTASEHFPVLVVWSLKDDPFVCLEPWSGPRFGFNSGQNLLWCPAGETLLPWVEFEVL